MRIPSKRIQRTRLVPTDQFVVAVEVEAVVPDADPSDGCYESEVVGFLRDIELHADRGDVEWLKKHGEVNRAMDAA